ncbi:MAG: isoleucine--tRNA ligase [Bacilli bacterium]
MSKFEELDKNKVSEVESKILKEWTEKDIYNKTLEIRKDAKNFVFYDGPATANGYPGLHHMIAKFLKDSFCKFKTMQGYRVIRKIGWDTHGLPVELQVEKELKFTGKQDIEKYGIEPFNQKCRESVWKNKDLFEDLTLKMGQFVSLDDPYITYKNDYIETEWWILKKFFDEGLFYEGHKILPYCPRCGTGLASHEVAQGYKEISVDTVTVPFKLKGEENTYFLVWTTTPWTLISNVGLCVNPKESYIKVKSQDNYFIIASKLATKVLGEDYEIIENYIGANLEYKEYEQLLPFLKVDRKGFFVTCDNYVTMEDGTGIVHIAPAFGEDDNKVAVKYNLPFLNPVGDDGKYKEGPWKGLLVFDADLEVIKLLKEQGKLFKKQKMMHNYPHCWRCSTPLIYSSKPSYYLKVTAFKDKIIENNKQVNWFPSFVGEKRFGNWLEELKDWAISRNRYWGTPLPYYICECGHDHMVGSRKELVEMAIEKIDETIDLHRPYVDNIHLKCPKCGGTMTRTKDVIDCWFDSGSMPFAQYHYPFENEELFESQFPADFICEGIDQTRGWFYTLMVISTFVKGCSPFKNVLVNELLLDAEGKKMSKSKGNIVEPFTTMKDYGADIVRWYVPYASPIWTPLKFDIKGFTEVHSKFFSTFKNTYSFFALYANTDEVDPREFEVDYKDLSEIDKWLLSKYNRLVKYVTEAYETYDLTKVVRSITDFVSEDLSNWYIRRNRRRFWASELDMDKKAVYSTTHKVLVGIAKLIAPVAPFTAEEVYQKLTGEDSVHTSNFPEVYEEYINEHIESRMDLVRELIKLGRNGREEVKIKVRQPLNEVLIDGKHESLISDLVSLIEEELNVKKVIFTNNINTYMNFMVKPNFKVCGPIFGKNIKGFQDALLNLSSNDITTLQSNRIITVTVDSVDYEVGHDMVDIRILAKEGFNVSMENNNFIILDTTLTDELIEEGIAREMISKIQNLRKLRDFNIVDRITIFYHGDEEVLKTIEKQMEFIKNETLATSIEIKENLEETFDLNGHITYLDVKNNKD